MQELPAQNSPSKRLFIEIGIFVVVLAAAIYYASYNPTLLEQIKNRGELTVVTLNGPTTHYFAAEGSAGLEYDLSRHFADYLGVELSMVMANNEDELFEFLQSGQADLAAAGLSRSIISDKELLSGAPYQEIESIVVRKPQRSPPKRWEDFTEKRVIHITPKQDHITPLERLKEQHAALTWQIHPEADAEELLRLVWEGTYDFAVADSNELAMFRRFYPELKNALQLSSESLAWAFRLNDDLSLFKEAETFFKEIRESGELAQTLERYYGPTSTLNLVDTRSIMRHSMSRLTSFKPWFEAAAKEYAIDWRLLAAIGYQESHWDPNAVSPTGVRGLMMLTQKTAGQMGISNRLDPEQSIMGGAKYLQLVKSKVPERIQEPDRTWFALASYNVGFGHLEDARKLTQSEGDDPDRWVDVKKYLPLLSQKKWYEKTRFGYARGNEPVRYVENIRSYYDILTWISEQEEAKPLLGDEKKPLIEETPPAL